MTNDEHRLIALMFTRQAVKLNALIRTLWDRGILTGTQAIAASTGPVDASDLEIQKAVFQAYEAAAEERGLGISLRD